MGILDWFTKRKQKKDDDLFSLDDDVFKDDPLKDNEDISSPKNDPASPTSDPFASPQSSEQQFQKQPGPSSIMNQQKQQFQSQQQPQNPYDSQPIQSPQFQQQNQQQTGTDEKHIENINLKIDMLKMMINNLDQKVTNMNNNIKRFMESENRRKYY